MIFTSMVYMIQVGSGILTALAPHAQWGGSTRKLGGQWVQRYANIFPLIAPQSTISGDIVWIKIKQFLREAWQEFGEAAAWTVDWVNGDD